MHPDPRAQTLAQSPDTASESAQKDPVGTAGTLVESDAAAATLAEPRLKPGRRRDLLKDLVGRVLKSQYRIESQLGQGAMGVVFRGVQLGLDKPVAIKMMRPDVFHSPESLDRFQREAQLVSKIIHPSIAQVLDYGVDDDIPFVVMEFVDGKELTEVMAI